MVSQISLFYHSQREVTQKYESLFHLVNECSVFVLYNSEGAGELKSTAEKEPRSPSSPGAQNSADKKESSKRGKRRVRALDDSDEDDTESERGLHNGHGESNASLDDKENKATSGNAAASNSDLEYSRNISDSEDVNYNPSGVRHTEAGKKRARDDDSDGPSDDDDDDEKFNLPLNSHKKARRIVVDDDDDEE